MHVQLPSKTKSLNFGQSRDYKPLLCSTGLIKKFILLINVKIPTAVCIIQNNYQHLSVFKQGMSLFYCFFLSFPMIVDISCLAELRMEKVL